MQNKLQELTDKLYNEGLSKGKQEAEQMKANAKTEAAAIISDAQQKAKEIVAAAQQEAAELKSKSENDVKMAATQAFTAIRQQIEKAIITKVTAAPISAQLNDTEFFRSILTTIVSAFNPASAEPVPLNLILPEDQKAAMDNFIGTEINKLCTAGLHVSYSKNIGSGFKIGPQGEGYMISFTDKDFENIISEYLRPKTKTLLFGE